MKAKTTATTMTMTIEGMVAIMMKVMTMITVMMPMMIAAVTVAMKKVMNTEAQSIYPLSSLFEQNL